MGALRAEARTDREAFWREMDAQRAAARTDREAFEKRVTELTQGQSKLTGVVEELRTAGR